MTEKQEIKSWAWWLNCAAGAFVSVALIESALTDHIPAWAVAVGVAQFVRALSIAALVMFLLIVPFVAFRKRRPQFPRSANPTDGSPG